MNHDKKKKKIISDFVPIITAHNRKANHHIITIPEGSCVTEDWRNDDK